MTRDEIKSKITTAVLELFAVEEEQLTESAKLYEELDIDSIDTIDLLLSLNQGIDQELDFEPEHFRDVETLGDLLDVIEDLLR
jgi:acyl carrier protein